MKKLTLCLAAVVFAQLAGGCGLFRGGQTYDGSQALRDANPSLSEPPSYMDPDTGYHSDDK
jgi:hypothetical protein